MPAERVEVEITNRNRAAVHIIGRRFSSGVPRTLTLNELQLDTIRGNPWLWITDEDWDGPDDEEEVVGDEFEKGAELTYQDFSKKELKSELKARDLPVSGNVEDLIARLEEDDEAQESEEEEDEESDESDDNESEEDDEEES